MSPKNRTAGRRQLGTHVGMAMVPARHTLEIEHCPIAAFALPCRLQAVLNTVGKSLDCGAHWELWSL